MIISKRMRIMPLLLAILMGFLLIMPTTALAAEPKVNLRTTSTFAVLAGATITNTGPTVISGDAGGDVGLHPGSSFPGQAEATISGAVHLADAVALQAKADLTLAYDDAAGRSPTVTFAETDNQLGGKTLTTGVYRFGHADTANLTAAAPLILDAQGDPEAVFIFQATSDLVTASGSQIQLINGARFCRIFWQVGSDVTLGTNSQFVGHIFAYNSIWARNGATIQGQLLARNGEVTLDTNTITNGLCATLGTLHVIKRVVNDNGGTAVAADFNLYVKSDGFDVAGSPADGAAAPGTTYYLAPGPYVVSEDPAFGYLASYSGDSNSSGNVTIVGGGEKTVTITNNDVGAETGSATLTVIKHVINDDGRHSIASDFIVDVTIHGINVAGSPTAGAESPGITYTLSPGTYVVSEWGHLHYTVSYSGDSNANGAVTLIDGDNKTVTITNNDIRPNPKTGDNTDTGSASWIGISATVMGGILLLLGLFLCVLYRKKRTN